MESWYMYVTHLALSSSDKAVNSQVNAEIIKYFFIDWEEIQVFIINFVQHYAADPYQ